MSSNNTDKNIANAFEVIYNTYENMQKLLSYLESQAIEEGAYLLCSDRFLRWNGSDKNTYSWAYHSFILVFQSENDTELKSGWRDGPLYVLDINLYDYGEAKVEIARFEYEDIDNLPSRISTSDFGVLHNPLAHYLDDGIMDYTEEDANYEGKVNDTALADKNYWGLRRIVGHSVPLTEITSENAYEIVFGGFDTLAGK